MLDSIVNTLNLNAGFSTPFHNAASVASTAAGRDIKNLAFAAALAGLGFVAIAFSIGGNRMRQMAKSHLVWIFAAIAIAAAIGGILNWMEGTGQSVFGNSSGNFANNTILPMLRSGKDYLMTILP